MIVDIFTCIHFHEFAKIDNFAWIQISLSDNIASLTRNWMEDTPYFIFIVIDIKENEAIIECK